MASLQDKQTAQDIIRMSSITAHAGGLFSGEMCMASCDSAGMTASLRRQPSAYTLADPAHSVSSVPSTLVSAHSPSRSPHIVTAAPSHDQPPPPLCQELRQQDSIHRVLRHVCPQQVNTATYPVLLSSPWSCAVVSFTCTLQGFVAARTALCPPTARQGSYRNRTATAYFAKGDRHYCRFACICVLSYLRRGDARRSD